MNDCVDILIKDWHSIIDSHIREITECLESSYSIGKEYFESKQDNGIDSFNVFRIISDLYYRENFHSDIIRFFLAPDESHYEGNKFLRIFIQMLNKTGRNINFNDYRDAIAIREEGRIDILIKSEFSKKAIIIENKINNARDMQRQLPRYYDYVSQCYKIDAIVYLPLEEKKPDDSDWSETDKLNVNQLLVIIPAYNKSKINIADNWLKPCTLSTDNIDVISTLRQYSQLIIQLNRKNMDTIVLEKFYNELINKKDYLKTAQSIREMLNNIPCYMAYRIQNEFGQTCYPFEKIWIYKSADAVFEKAIIDGIYTKMDIWCYEDRYDVLFWCPDENIEEKDFSDIVGRIQSLKDFKKPNGNVKNQVVKQYGFFEESTLFDFIREFLKELSQMVSDK